MKEPKTSRKKPRRKPWDMLRFVVKQRGTPEAIALGLSLGMFITFSPTVGIQLVLAFLIATLFNANRLAATLPIWITNVFTVPPIYAFTYRVGLIFLPDRPPANVRRVLSRALKDMAGAGWYNLPEHVGVFLRAVGDLFYPMLIGGFVVGGIVAGITYPVTLRTVRRYRRRRAALIRARADELAQQRRGHLLADAKEHALAALKPLNKAFHRIRGDTPPGRETAGKPDGHQEPDNGSK